MPGNGDTNGVTGRLGGLGQHQFWKGNDRSDEFVLLVSWGSAWRRRRFAGLGEEETELGDALGLTESVGSGYKAATAVMARGEKADSSWHRSSAGKKGRGRGSESMALAWLRYYCMVARVARTRGHSDGEHLRGFEPTGEQQPGQQWWLPSNAGMVVLDGA